MPPTPPAKAAPFDLFDVQCGFGGAAPGAPESLGAQDILREMRRLAIGRALVRMTPESMETDIPFSNRKLYAACRGRKALVPCPVVAPNTARDLPTEEAQVEAAIRRGAGAAWIRPGPDGWLTAEWASGRIFAALEERRLPLICLERLVGVADLADLARRHPELPLILAEVGYRANRVLIPLLERFPNLHLSLGPVYTAHRGIEQFVEIAGADRLLFGSGWPDAEAMAAVTQLAYAEISEPDRRRIGAGNLQRLIAEVRR